jgi:arsenate reductase
LKVSESDLDEKVEALAKPQVPHDVFAGIGSVLMTDRTRSATKHEPSHRPRRVIFACVHNAGRSQMAAAIFNRLTAPTRARAVSAGTSPPARVHPDVVETMQELGVDLSTATPSRLTQVLVEGAEMPVTMGCGDQCPVVPGVRRDDWSIEDPKGQTRERVRQIRDEIRACVAALIAREGWASGQEEQ